MTRIPVPAPGLALASGRPALNDFANGQSPGAVGIRELADMLHALLCRRGRVLFASHIHTVYVTATSTDTTTLRCAFRTGPFARSIRIVYVLTPAAVARAASDSYGYWVLRTGLTGTGLTSTSDNVYSTANYTGTLKADDLVTGSLTFAVAADAPFRLECHQINVFSLRSICVYEDTRAVLDTGAESAIDVAKIAHHWPITTTTMAGLRTLASTLWKRGGHPLLWWSTTDGVGLAETGSSVNNLHDGTTTATASTFGHPVSIPYSGALHTANVGVVAWVCARVNNALATGTVQFRDQAGNVICSVSVTGTADDETAWYSTTGNLSDASGATPTTRVEVYGSVTATYQLIVYAYGMFQYVA